MPEISTPLEALTGRAWDSHSAAHADLVGAAQSAGFAVRKQRASNRNVAGIFTRTPMSVIKAALALKPS